MAQIARNLVTEIKDIIATLSDEREREGRTEKARLLSIAITNLETAMLFLEKSGSSQ